MDCADPSARYEVVVTDSGPGHDLGTCDGYPDGEQTGQTNAKTGVRWEMCTVPHHADPAPYATE